MNYHNCPRYSSCSVPKCPLDHGIDKRDRLPGEPDCPLSKAKRYKLGEGLPNHGLTKRELAARLNWERKSGKDRIEMQDRLRKFSFQPSTPD